MFYTWKYSNEKAYYHLACFHGVQKCRDRVDMSNFKTILRISQPIYSKGQ
jgi:hypothetical protein